MSDQTSEPGLPDTDPAQRLNSMHALTDAPASAVNAAQPARAPRKLKAARPVADLKTSDPTFDASAFRVSSTSQPGQVGVVRRLLTVPVKRPNKQTFIRVHPTNYAEYQLLRLREEAEEYLVHPDIAASMPGETTHVMLRLAVTRHGAVFFWPLVLPSDDRPNLWHVTALQAAKLAETQWVRVVPDQTAGGYQTHVATAANAEPTWPMEDFDELLAVAFPPAKRITEVGHPVLARLFEGA